MRRSVWLLLALVLALSACAQITLVPPERHNIWDAYSVETRIAWNQTVFPDRTSWTVNGYGLDTLEFFDPVEDGDSLFQVTDEKKTLPEFDSTMRATETMEFVIDSLSAIGASQIKGSNLRPASFGDNSGYRFDLTYLSEDGLAYKAVVIGTVHEDRLYLAMYRAPSLHYFDRYSGEAEYIFSSLTAAS